MRSMRHVVLSGAVFFSLVLFSCVMLPLRVESEALRFFMLDEPVSRGYSVLSEVCETSSNIFRISIAAHFPPGSTINDGIWSYHIYVNDSIEILADYVMWLSTIDGLYDIFSATAVINESIQTIRLVPEWDKGGLEEADAVSGFVKIR